MSRRIYVLPDVVANQIAAGEVVERPTSVVKELVENALDAHATRIEVDLEGGGKRRIRVADDGIGMGREDALACLDRHATSKIAVADDLTGVRTFGFRGEALPSIAAVSRLVLDTREGVEEAGTRITVEGGRIREIQDLARQRGTTVDVRSLFFNAPARGKFLKAAAAETRAASWAFAALALANPRVAVRLTSDGRVLLECPVAEDPSARVAHVWGVEEAGTLIAASAVDGELEVHGLVQRPDAARAGLRRAQLFVNGRPFRSPPLVRAAERGYRTTVPDGARPWLLLYLQVPGGEVDVNVHPTKSEVRFRDPARVEELVELAVRRALGGEGSAAALDRAPATPAAAVRERPESARASEGRDDQTALFLSGPDGGPGVSGAAGEPFVAVDVAEGRPRLWQMLNTYIVAETRDGALVIDQHSAHERVLFERLMNAFEAGGEAGQRLLFPLTVRLSAPEYTQVMELRGLLERAGFQAEGFGGDTVIVHAVPNPHPYFDAERAFREMVAELTHGSELVRSARNQHERIAKTFACKAAVKAGQSLSDAEIGELFDLLFATELPHHDVHGRPTIVRLSAAELARRFGR